MLAILVKLERCAGAKLLAKRFHNRQVSELITCSLQEQHWNLHVKKMLSSLVGWLSRRMKRESQKHDGLHSGQRPCGLGLRSHPSAKRFATDEKCKPWNQECCFQDHRAHCRMSHLGRVGPFRSLLH